MNGRKEERGKRKEWARARVLALVLALGAAVPAAAQLPIAVLSEPGTTVVATEVLIATGRSDGEEWPPGMAYLAARSVIQPILPRLDSLGAELTVRPGKDAISFSLVAAPDAWEVASRILMLALFRDPVEGAAVERQRRAVHAELVGREANPVDVLAREADAAVFGPEHPWGRSEVGYASSIQQLTAAAVDNFLRTAFTAERTVVGVVGPADVESATQHLRPYFEDTERERPEVRPAQPLDSPVRRRYDSITTWIAASYRLPAGADLEALRMLADLSAQSLAFGPRQRSVYDAHAQVTPWAGGGELRLQVAVPPGEAEQWAQRVREAVTRFAAQPLPEDEFRALLRSYLGRRLLELSTPEARAREAARSLYLGGSAEKLPELEELTPARLRAAARSLNPPVLVLLGPFVDDAGEEG
ncbi:hypothetical protein BH24GEM3_BH24GEM3_11820 [soil metagenome]